MTINADDIQKIQQFTALGSRLMQCMMSCMPGNVNRQVIDELTSIHADYITLLHKGPPQIGLYTEVNVKAKIAETLEWIARAHDSLADWQGAVAAYQIAIQAFAELGDTASFKRCKDNVDKINVAQGLGIDKQLNKLLGRLETLNATTLEYIKTMVELADLYSGNEDHYEAERYYQKALQTLHTQGRSEPSGSELANSLETTLSNIWSNKQTTNTVDIHDTLLLRDLYRQIYMGLIRVYRVLNPEKIDEFDAKLISLEGDGKRDDFTNQLKKLIQGSLGDHIK